MPLGDSYAITVNGRSFLSQVRKLFIETFGTLDLHSHIRLKLVLQDLTELLDQGRPLRILDVGCGSGILAFELSKIVRRMKTPGIVEYVGFDKNPTSIAQATIVLEALMKRNRLAPEIDICFRENPPETLETSSYNIILLIDVLEHIEDDAELLASLAARLENGGHLLISVPTPNYPVVFGEEFHRSISHMRSGYSADALHKLIRRNGLVVERSRFNTGLISGFCCRLFYNYFWSWEKTKALILLISFPWILVDPLNSRRFSSSLYVRARKAVPVLEPTNGQPGRL
jgi:SAM-dependent methyltransferase